MADSTDKVVQRQDDGTTWKPETTHGKLSSADLAMLPNSVFAFPEARLLPLTDADHVMAALAQFRSVDGVPDGDRALAMANIRKAAAHYEVELADDGWQELQDFRE
ncbi:MAG: hypothetical protein DCC57_23980 [Chloroflexi bacterium]|nr:MAG: hypothetical protein DCC57_23980 [Chloroflexota bacterium]